MNKHTLKVEKREILGKKVKHLRNKGILPANVFGNRKSSLAISVNLADFEKVYREVGETGLIDILVEDTKVPALVSNVSFNPVSGKILHVDFRQVDLKEKITANVPVELIGESPAEKQGLGVAVSYLTELEVEALPSDLPERFTIDISKLTEIDQSISVKDVQLDSKVKITLDPETIIVKIEEQSKQEEAQTTMESSEQGEMKTESKQEDSSKVDSKE